MQVITVAYVFTESVQVPVESMHGPERTVSPPAGRQCISERYTRVQSGENNADLHKGTL